MLLKFPKSSVFLVLVIFFALIILPYRISAQVKSTTQAISAEQSLAANTLLPLAAAIDTFNKRLPTERIFVHTDKSFYSQEDTLWFKSYLFSNTLNYSKLSGIMYLELINDSATVIKRISVPVIYGFAWGQIALSADAFNEGFYTLRAYTNWMQNFGDESFFKKRIYISNPSVQHWIVNQASSITVNDHKKILNSSVQFKTADSQPLGYKTIQWRLTDGKRTIAKDVYETVSSTLEAHVDLNENVKGPLFIQAEEKGGEKQKITFPVIFKQADDVDVQFLPESGYLVADLPCNIAFKALNSAGKAVDVEGVIKNSKNEEMSEFSSVHKGMGSFSLTPAVNDTYTAVLKLPGGITKSYNLPEVKSSGTVLQIYNGQGSDSLRVSILFSENLVTGQNYKLVGFTHGEIAYAANFKASRQRVSGRVSKSLFPTGVAHFTLFNDKNEPLNERISFINHQDNLRIKVSSPKSTITTRDSVPVQVEISDKNGKPVQGSFSLAVTDNSQIKTDSLENNILSEIYLNSELKGDVEDGGWYFNGTSEAQSAIDLLMLTQGWIGYKWKDIFNVNVKPAFRAEPELKVSGRVSNILNKPVSNSKLLLLAGGKYHFIMDTVSNASGLFTFRNLPPVDTVSFFVQARNARGKSFNVGLEMDEFKPSPVTKKTEGDFIPWFVNSNESALELVKNKEKLKTEQLKDPSNSKMLKAVVVTAKKAIRNSKNLNGPGEADQVLDEKEALAAGNVDLIQLLEKKIKGFSLRMKQTEKYYYLFDKKVRFVVDGIELNRLFMESDPPVPFEYYNFINTALTSIDAADVLGVEVMYNLKNTSNYGTQFLSTEEQLSGSMNIAFIEITTRSGNGISVSKTPGVAVYRPLPITWPKQYYQPKYTAANQSSKSSDFRTTLFWIPNLITNSSGQANTYFYSSDKTGSYTLIVQGSDMMGGLGYSTTQMQVGNKK